MGRFEERRAELEKRGARLAAVATDPVETSRELVKDRKLGFPILSDPTGEAIQAFGVWHAEKKIALPAIIVIDRTGKVRWRRVGESVTDRPEEDEVLDVVAGLER